MAEVNAKDLTTKTSPASTDSMLLFGTTSNEGAKITVDNLADNILSRLSTKTFPNQVGGSSAATILAQLATLNSNSINGGRIDLVGSESIQNQVDALLSNNTLQNSSVHFCRITPAVMTASGYQTSSYFNALLFCYTTSIITLLIVQDSGTLVLTLSKLGSSSASWNGFRRLLLEVVS